VPDANSGTRHRGSLKGAGRSADVDCARAHGFARGSAVECARHRRSAAHASSCCSREHGGGQIFVVRPCCWTNARTCTQIMVTSCWWNSRPCEHARGARGRADRVAVATSLRGLVHEQGLQLAQLGTKFVLRVDLDVDVDLVVDIDGDGDVSLAARTGTCRPRSSRRRRRRSGQVPRSTCASTSRKVRVGPLTRGGAVNEGWLRVVTALPLY
jgi:hypothetical protein